MTVAPRYALPEIERRWLVVRAAAPPLSGKAATITDKYLHDSRLRLRRVQSAEPPTPDRPSTAGHDGLTTTFKLCRKYGDRSGPCESITNLYLDLAEYRLLDRLPGTIVTKRRYRLEQGSIDVYEGGSQALLIYEVEFASVAAALAFEPPAFAGTEITGSPDFSGAALARRFG